MKIPPLAQFREELKEISLIISSPDSQPGRQMSAKRENNSQEWKEEEDIRRFDANLDQYLEDFDRATERLASQPRA